MANFANNRWSAFQYKLNEIMQMPEFKHKPSTALSLFLKNTNFLIPSSEKERILGVKQSDQDTVYVNYIKKTSHSVGSARAAAHTESVGDGGVATATFTTYAADFTYTKKTADRTIWQEADLVAKEIRSAAIALHSSIETAFLAQLSTYKNQSVISATPLGGTWDATNFVFQIAFADKNRWMQRAKGFMRQQYYSGMFDAIVDEELFQYAEYLIQQGQGNATNLGWQAQNLDIGVSEEIAAADGYDGTGYIIPAGTVGVLPWIPRFNRINYGNPGEVGGYYTSIPDPLGSGLQFAVHEYYTAADNASGSGETQDINVNVELSIDLAPVIAPMSTSNGYPINKFGVIADSE